jgi:hypothetical protein
VRESGEGRSNTMRRAILVRDDSRMLAYLHAVGREA